ncbi:MAG: hypothetical protein A2351_07350 [Omnitrophica bacterium RIFOXYB12_FULL_50_7]|nr:MAG: hypothetical protein A2351_07350 [Omnitrophica bacterium RIFOXYB12_FULL_50_7]
MKGLCFRCEHRARYLEDKIQPRYECGQPALGVYSCYMFRPVRPLVLKQANKKDPRPILSMPMISGRVCGVRIADGKAVAKKLKDGIAVFWQRIK